MKEKLINKLCRFKCLYKGGECYYKNPANFQSCVGCKYAILKKHKTLSAIDIKNNKEKQELNKRSFSATSTCSLIGKPKNA